MAKRIRIFFINCPSLAVEAAAFLILAQNKVQSVVEFEVHHFWIYGKTLRRKPKGIVDRIFAFNEDGFYSFGHWPWPLSKCLEPLSRWLERKNRTRLDLRGAPQFRETFKVKESLQKCLTAITAHDDWFESSGYNRYDTRRDIAIVVTETPLAGRFLGNCGKEVAIVSAARWADFFRPVSGLEYVLTSIQRFTLRLLYGPSIGTHYPSRGCVWDFHVHQPDAKTSAYLGFLCETCRSQLEKHATAHEYEQLRHLIDNEWIGSESDVTSVAGMLKKNYGYSLSRSAGLHPSLFSSVAESMKSEFGKFLIEIVKWTAIVLITLFAITYFPDVTKKWKNMMSGSPEATPMVTATQESTPTPASMISPATDESPSSASEDIK